MVSLLAWRGFVGVVSLLSCRPLVIRRLFSVGNSGYTSNDKPFHDSVESAEDFERRIFDGVPRRNQENNPFFQRLNEIENAHGKSGSFASQSNSGDIDQSMDGLDESFSTLSDGMDGKLKKAATYFAFTDEVENEDYKFRPDVTFPSGRDLPGMTYTLKDLDLTKPGVQRPIPRRKEFETTTEEVLKKADFRNVRFLANFITAAGIIKKRKMTGISAKAQRKVAREIKTARAMGLMPFTTMGKWPFKFGVSMEETEDDYRHPFARRTIQPEMEVETEPPEAEEVEDPYA